MGFYSMIAWRLLGSTCAPCSWFGTRLLAPATKRLSDHPAASF